MSAFQRLRQLPLGDLLHRGLLYSLVGVTGWGVFMIGAVHVDTMRRGKGMFIALALKEATEAREPAKPNVDAAREMALAELAANAASRRT